MDRAAHCLLDLSHRRKHRKAGRYSGIFRRDPVDFPLLRVNRESGSQAIDIEPGIRSINPT